MDASHEISLKVAASRDDMLIARMALSGLGMLAGLDTDSIGDLRTVINECFDCLTHQSIVPSSIIMEGAVKGGRLHISFSAQGDAGQGDAGALDLDIVRGILETLMPEVALLTGERGVERIQCSMPV